jgi:tape measure domain-containing protein
MASIDNRVVEMKFDNAAFETKIASTIASLDKLEASLKLPSAGKGFADVNTAAQNVSFNPLTSGIDSLVGKFSSLSIIGITALTNIANKAVDAGISIGKSLSIDQVMSGFREYETNMNAIQTVLANTKSQGTNLNDVNSALDKLNEYSDKTIYNFGQMAKNIGTFTAAGVDLDTSVQSIKGIANLAAISGSSSEQASTAMYQLSQAISSGTVKLMDWNSVTNAGMGGKVFQEALFNTGVALNKIKDAPVGTTFKEWTDAGNTFRGTLEQGWLTSDVLTTTLQGIAGELTEAQLLAIGYTQEQSKAIIELGITGVEAATKVRTFSQLMTTARETVGSGFSQSFRIILGDFNQATELFTGISAAFGKIAGESADSRNALLTQWANIGGREAVINGLTNAAKALGAVITTVKSAFSGIFPPMTGIQLTRLSFAFEDFTKKLTPSIDTLHTIRLVSSALFGVIEIGYTFVKELAGSFLDLFKALGKSEGASGVLKFITYLSADLKALNNFLVTDGGIAKAFDAVTDSILRFARDPAAELKRLKDIALEIFGVLTTGYENLGNLPSGFVDFLNRVRDALIGISLPGVNIERLSQRFQGFKDTVESISGALAPVIAALEKFGGYIVNWFKELAGKMKSAAAPGDFSKVLDAVNLGIVASIGGMLAFLTKGVNLDFGGIFGGLKNTLSEATGVLKGMQMDLKANAIMKIGIAIGILAVSVLLLASVDSAALTKALVATAAGLAILMGALNSMATSMNVKSASVFTIVSTGMIALSAAMLLLAFAVKTLGGLSIADLAQGLIAIQLLINVLQGIAQQLSANSKGLIRAGIGLIGIAIALNILASAVFLFGSMDLLTMGQGLLGVTVGLIVISGALNAMPADTFAKAAGLMLVAGALTVLAIAVKLFATMSWEEMAKGFGSVAVGLTIIAFAMHLMPSNMLLTAAGLIAVSLSLLIIAEALKQIATLTWNDIIKGLVGIAGSLLILTLAAHAMSGALAGAAAMVVMAGALHVIAGALATVGKLTLSEIVKGLFAIAAVFAVLAIAAVLIQPAIPAMLALGAALMLLGVGIALFGLGVNALARGLQILVGIFKTNIEFIISMLDKLLERIPVLIVGLTVGLLAAVDIILEALPIIIEQLGIIIAQLIDTLITLLPKVEKLIIALIDSIIRIVDEKAVDVLMAGYRLLIGLINGITEHIDEFVTAVVGLIAAFINSLAQNIGKIVEAGMNLLRSFIKGLIDNIVEIATMVGELIAAFIEAVITQYTIIIQAGVDLLIQFLSGVKDNLSKVIDAVTEVITTFITEIGNSATKIAKAGADALTDFLDGIADNIGKIGGAVGNIITKFIETVSNNSKRIIKAGTDAIVDFIEGIGDAATEIAIAAVETITDFAEALAKAIDDNVDDFKAAGRSIAWNILDGATLGLAGGVKDLAGKAINIGKSIVGGIGGFLGINSPSKVFIGIGESIIEGLAMGLDRTGASDTSATNLAQSTTDTFTRSLQSLSDSLDFTNEFNPTITPVLDLTNVRVGARAISGLISSTNGINATVSTGQAQTIAATETPNQTIPTSQNGSNEVRFEQNIYAPTQLSTSDIYRQTRNQITIAKEELSIL